MAWPTALTVDSDLTKHVFFQGLTRILETGNFANVHISATTEIGHWLETDGGIPDRDLISNTDDFVPAAAHLVAAKVIRAEYPDQADQMMTEWRRLMHTTPRRLTSSGEDRGGRIGPIAISRAGAVDARGTGAPRHFYPRRSGSRFK